MSGLDDIEKVLKAGLWSPKLVVVHSEKIVLANGAYVVGDVVSENVSFATGARPWLFPGCARENGGGGYIVHAEIQAQTTAIGGWFALHLYNNIPTCELGDGIPSTCPILADRKSRQGMIDFSTNSGIGTNEMDSSEAVPSTIGRLPKAFVCDRDSRDLQGVLVIRNAVDLADTTVLQLALWIEQW